MLGVSRPARMLATASSGDTVMSASLPRHPVRARLTGMEHDVEQQLVHAATDEMRVPFWVVLAGVGAGAFWALAGVVVGSRLRRRT